jgi:hypothetical protein
MDYFAREYHVRRRLHSSGLGRAGSRLRQGTQALVDTSIRNRFRVQDIKGTTDAQLAPAAFSSA